MSRRPYKYDDFNDREHYSAGHMKAAAIVFALVLIGYGIYSLFEWLF